MLFDGQPDKGPRIVVREYDSSSRTTISCSYVSVAAGQETRAGRAADGNAPDRLLIGCLPLDTAVSRDALIVTPREQGWEVTVRNKRGATLHPWGLAPIWLEGGSAMTKRWPRLAVRVPGSVIGLEHWLLLEHDDYAGPMTSDDAPADTVSRTNIRRPPPLTEKQVAALRGVFSEYLEWPVRSAPQPVKLQSVARALRISDTGVTERLEGAKAKARLLGLHDQAGLTQPDYLFALVASGYLEVPTVRVDAVPLF